MAVLALFYDDEWKKRKLTEMTSYKTIVSLPACVSSKSNKRTKTATIATASL